MIRFENVTAGYGDTTVLDGFSTTFDTGFNVLLGPNGAGKTTLFRCGSGIVTPDAGTVTVDGTDVHAEPDVKTETSYLPHRPVLTDALTVRENLTFWGRVHGLAPEQIDDRVQEIAAQISFTDLLETPAEELSRGQMQRAAVGQALLSDPSVLFLDEATTGLDPRAARDLRQLLTRFSEDRVVIYSTHNLYEASELADRVALVRDGELLFDRDIEWVREEALESQRLGLKSRDDDAGELLTEWGYDVERQGAYYVIELTAAEPSELVRRLTEAGVDVREVKAMDNALEAVFQQYERGGEAYA